MAADASDLVPRLLDTLSDAVVVASGDGRILRVNEAARRLLGYKPGEAEAGLRLIDLHQRPDEVRAQREALARRPADQTAHGDARELTLRARNGDPIAVRARVSAVRNAEGSIVGSVHAYEDVREENALRARLERGAAEVQAWEARVASQPAMARAAHELSQPLTAALGHIDLLLIEGGIPDGAVDRLERAAEQLERLRNLVHDLTRSASTPRSGRVAH